MEQSPSYRAPFVALDITLFLTMSTPELVSIMAAVASAVGGAFAAVAAFRSAGSARDAQRAADEAERRALLRQVVLTAKDVALEARRTLNAAVLTLRSHKDLATFSGGLGGSRHQLAKDALADKSAGAAAIEKEGKVFDAWPSSLEKAPVAEIDRVLTKLLGLFSEARSAREDLEQERADIERQCDLYRKRVIEGVAGQ